MILYQLLESLHKHKSGSVCLHQLLRISANLIMEDFDLLVSQTFGHTLSRSDIKRRDVIQQPTEHGPLLILSLCITQSYQIV